MIRLWTLLGRPARLHFILALAFSAAAGAFSIILLGLSGWFLTAAALAGAAGSGLVFNHLYPSAGVRASAFGRVLTRYADQLVGHDATLRLSALLRPKLFSALASSQRGMSPMTAEELSSLIDDVSAAEGGFLRVIAPGAALLASLIIAIGFTFAADPISGAIALVALLGLTIPGGLFALRQNKARAEDERNLARASRLQTARTVENAIELDILNALPQQAEATLNQLDAWSGARLSIGIPFRALAAILRGAGLVLAIFTLWRGVAGAADLAMSVGAALALMAAFEALAASLGLLNAANEAELASNGLADQLEHPGADWNPALENAQELQGIFPIVANDLVARAADDAHPTPSRSFEIHAGDLIQIIGPSGCGKSTLAETLMRLQPVGSGELSFGGLQADKLRMASVLERISIAPQFPAFLPGTLREQMHLAAPGADDDSIWQVLTMAQCDTFLNDKDAPLDTEFENGVAPFSGGQTRRISIARALMASPDILILDEPFAGLEKGLAADLASNLIEWALAGSRALIILAHAPQDFPDSALTQKLIDLS